jgi:DHA2 family multidrug resistance protein
LRQARVEPGYTAERIEPGRTGIAPVPAGRHGGFIPNKHYSRRSSTPGAAMNDGADFAAAARPYRLVITFCIIAAALLQTLDATVANVALPHIQGSLSATTDQVSWVLTSYLIAAAIMTPAVGWLAGRFGRRQIYLWSMAGFTIASMACGGAQTLEQMVMFRMIQGVFGAALVPLSQAVMLDMYAPHERGNAMAIWSVGVMVGPIIGPTLGAWLTDNYNWRYVFYVNLPVGIVGYIGMWAFLPASVIDRVRKFDWVGFTALAVGIAGLQLALDRGETKDWFGSYEVIAEATASAIGFYIFAVQMVLAPRPFLTMSTFRDRNYVTSLGLQFTCGVVLNATAALLPPYFQGLGNYPVMLSGIALAPRGLGTIVGAPVVGWLLNRVDPRKLMLLGLGVLAYSTWQMSTWTPDVSIEAQLPMVFLQGVTISLVFVPLQTVAFSSLAPALRTECSGVIALFRNLGGSIGVSVMETLLARNTQVAHQDLARFATPFNRALHSGAPAQYWNLGTAQGRASLDALINWHAQVVAYTDDFLFMLVGMAPAAGLILLMRRPAHAIAPSDAHAAVD